MSKSTPSKRRAPVHQGSARALPVSELSRHWLRAQEEERRHISRELHDGTGQGLMVLRLYLGMLASESLNPESQAKIQEALKLLDHTVEDLRRIIRRLSPRALEEMGLLAAIRKSVRDLSRGTGLKARLELSSELGELDPELEVALYRSLQEALHNIAKHAQAQQFLVSVHCSNGSICLRVEDDGVGFSGHRPSRSRSFGLLGMKQRIAALGGTVRISSRKAGGTCIKILLPWQAEPETLTEAEKSTGLTNYGNSTSELSRRALAASH